MTRWIYIMGRGHSGSTMLDAILGNAPEIESVGELVSGMGRYDASCSCGETFRHCSYWREVRSRFETLSHATWDRAVQACTDQANVARFLPTLLASLRSPWASELVRMSAGLADAIGNGGPLVLDSSKEISRGLFMARMIDGSTIIHLVRHPYGVLSSNLRRLRSGQGFKLMRRRFEARRFPGMFLLLSAAGWSVGNVLAEIVALRYRRKVVRIRYEDFLADPSNELAKIEQAVGVRLDGVRGRIAAGEDFEIGHNVGGNQMRFERRFRVRTGVPPKADLPLRYRVMTWVVCWPIMLRYGYR